MLNLFLQLLRIVGTLLSLVQCLLEGITRFLIPRTIPRTLLAHRLRSPSLIITLLPIKGVGPTFTNLRPTQHLPLLTQHEVVGVV